MLIRQLCGRARASMLASLVGLSALLVMPVAEHAGDITLFAYQFRAYSGTFAQLLDLESNGSVAAADPVVNLIGAVTGLTFVEGVLHGIESESKSSWYVVTIPHEGTAHATRIGSAINLPNIEALAYSQADGTLYGVSFNSQQQQGSLIEVDPVTGDATLIGGPMATDIFIVGLAAAPNGTLYGVNRPWGGLTTASLYIIDAVAGVATRVGPLKLTAASESGPIEALAWRGGGELIGAFDKLYSIDTLTGVASEIGGDYTTPDPRDGVFGLADLSGFVPVRATSWSMLKANYR